MKQLKNNWKSLLFRKKPQNQFDEDRFSSLNGYNPEELSIIKTQFEKALDDLTKNFTYAQVGEQKIEVNGFLKERFPKFYQIFINLGIFEIATYKLFQTYQPELIRILDIKAFDTHKYKGIPLALFENYEFDAWPRRKFDRIMLYCPGEFSDCIEPMEDFPFWYKGYKIKGNLAKAELVLLGFALPDFPVAILSYSPKLGLAISSLSIQFENLKDEIIDVLRKIIREYRADSEIEGQQIEQEKTRGDKWRRMYERSEQNFLTQLNHKTKDREKLKGNGIYLKSSYFTLLILLLLVLTFAVMFAFSNGGFNPISNNSTISNI